MMKNRILVSLLLIAILLLQTPNSVFAADTVFMVPEISETWEPPGTVYKSPALDSLAYQGSGGFVADIINNRGLAAAVADLNANVDPSQYGVSILGIYPEGEALTDDILNEIKNAGWKKIEVYYPTFFLGGSPDCAGMEPVIEKIANDDISASLKILGYEEEVAAFKVEGVSMKNPGIIYYEPEFNFLSGKTTIMYKYFSDIQKFVAGPTVLYDSYDSGFMDIEGIDLADGEVNGIYVIVTKELPSDAVITKDQIQTFRDQLKAEETQTTEEETEEIAEETTKIEQESDESTKEIVITDKDEEVKWKFANGEKPENFTPEVQMEVKSEKEVKVSFTYSGKLPEGTSVTIQLPKESVKYQDGTKLYFYYYNSDINEYEYVSEGKAENGEVTFDIKHCSEYLITTEKVGIGENGPDLLPIIVIGAIVLCIAGGVICVVRKKR